jgi:hypothetical protein
MLTGPIVRVAYTIVVKAFALINTDLYIKSTRILEPREVWWASKANAHVTLQQSSLPVVPPTCGIGFGSHPKILR